MGSRIEDYAVVGDLQTAALVGRDGSVDWLCLPSFDSGACFAALLGDRQAGRWRVAPAGAGDCTSRRYVGESLVLEQTWETPTGTVRVLDLMPPRGEAPDLVRIVEGVEGEVEVESDLVVRFDYGSVVPWVRHPKGRWSAVAGPDALWLDTPVRLEGRDDRTTSSRFRVRAGERVPFVLTWHESYRKAPHPVDPEHALQETLRFWRHWLRGSTYAGPYEAAVRRSLVVLKALTYAPTGGVVAAVTTSLPEALGGVRNWDYRFCWLRDAAFTLQALAGAGFVDEAKAWRRWLLRAAAGDPADVQIMYGLDGRRRLPEHELPWLAGYEGSSPVRVGNAAVDQFQLDVYGEVLDGLHAARSAGLSANDDAWDLQVAITEHLATVWRRPDRSLWEVRGPERHFVHSKVMAWVGFDRMVRTAEEGGLDAPLDRWRAERDAVHAQVCEQGWDAERGTFTQYYGSRGLDAALLLLPRLGFLPPEDPRVRSTVRAVQRELCEDGFVVRYRPDADPEGEHGSVDGLPGTEGAFLACSFWLADALALIGEEDEAVALFERLLGLCNDVGLLSEMWDPHLGRQLGNTPQAFSHVELVNTAIALGAHRPERLRTDDGTDARGCGPG
ncbi:glycoside hydrolase family 15 protein [Vallicoccus soli]|uniref:Trehalase n=1 Tax=Vallicoccus soli TaxID=2339232 RepID=A0A3A3Z021_9ACTN|nr:glycoside hydrolase family 15 protein [Vallicoccus soli]RJK97589.1 glycoside hydrolase family 15 protein [Vallicoccus soli]